MFFVNLKLKKLLLIKSRIIRAPNNYCSDPLMIFSVPINSEALVSTVFDRVVIFSFPP